MQTKNVPTFAQLCAQLCDEAQTAVQVPDALHALDDTWHMANAIADLADFNYVAGDTTDIGGDTDCGVGVAASTRLVAACCATLAQVACTVAQGLPVRYMGSDTNTSEYAAWQADWFAHQSADDYAYRVSMLANAVALLAVTIASGCGGNAVVPPQLASCHALRASLLPAEPGTLGDSAGILAELAIEAVLGQY